MHTDGLDGRELVKGVAASFALLAGFLLLLGVLGDLFVFDGGIARAELEALRWVADHRSAPIDSLARTGSSLTDTWTVLGLVGGVTVVLWAAGHQRQALLLPVGLVMEFGTFLLVSTIIGRARPAVTPLGSVPSTSSFPSGHVAAAVVVYGGLAVIVASFRPGRSHRVAICVVAVIVAFVGASRLYEGVHHPSDVLAGVLLGAGALLAASHCTGLAPFEVTRRTDRGLEPRPEEVHSR